AAGQIEESELDARAGVTLFGGFAEPGEGQGIVLRDAFAAEKHVGKVILAKWITGVSGPAIPLGSGGLISFDTETKVKYIAEVDHGSGVSMFGGKLKIAAGLGVVLGHSPTVEIQDPEIQVSAGNALCSRGFEPIKGGAVVLGDAPAVEIENREVDLRGSVALEGGLLEPFARVGDGAVGA